MLNIVCVQSGTKYSNDYVNILLDSITRNVAADTAFKFICFTNKPEGLDIDIQVQALPAELEGRGWWNKLYLFKDGLFPDGDRIVFFDLKNVIISSLDDVLAYRGKFANLRDFLRPDGQQSGLMAWEANTLGHIWDEYVSDGYPEYTIIGDGIVGDHVWIEKTQPVCDYWQELFPHAFYSYKANHCWEGIPKGAKIIFFHGKPWPEDIKDGWVPQVWKIGGGTSLEFVTECNTDSETVLSNIRHAMALPISKITHANPEHKGHAVIVGGGPSIKNFIEDLQQRQAHGQTIVALNNSWEWCEKNSISVSYHVMVDARPENEDFIPKSQAIHKLYATQCHPKVSRFADTLWSALVMGLVPFFDKTHDMFWIGAGTTVGIRSIYLMYAMGYREFHIYGFDSCYAGASGHAYEQTLNKGERIIDIDVCGRKFKAAPWMVTQMHDFLEAVEHMTAIGCTFTIHGDGLLQHACLHGLQAMQPVDKRAQEVLKRIADVKNPVGVEVGVFSGEMSRRLLQRPDLTLYMVDSWKAHAPDSEYAKTGDFHGKLMAEQQAQYFQQAKTVTEFAGDRGIVFKIESLAAVEFLATWQCDGLDFIFLDADHTYDAVKKDIAAWSPQIKAGGLICGHDYAHPNFPDWGVKRAVDEFCTENGYKLELGDDYTWFIKLNKATGEK